MAGWYIRRGEKVVGPVEVEKLKELVAAGRLVPTDQLAKDPAGPWTEASRTKLFAHAPSTNLVAASSKPIAKSTAHPPAVPQAVEQPPAEPNKAIVAAKAGLGVLSSAGDAISRSWAERSRRKHELKLAKIQAQALAESRNHSVPVPPPPVATGSPHPQQTINVNVVQQVNLVGRGRRWSPIFAMFLSFLIPGLGQLYKGQPINGLVWFLITVAGYALLILPGLLLHLCCVIGAGMGDPYR